MPSLEKKVHVAPRHHHIHEDLMNARHRYIAHRNDKSYEGMKTFVVKNPADPKQFMVVYQSNTVAFNASPVIRDIIGNLEALSECIKGKIATLREKLEEEHRLKPLPVAPSPKRGRP